MERRTRRIGRYHLTDRIAFGGMAEVFRGFTFSDDGYRFDVAIKKLLPNYVEDSQFVTMLTDEYRLVSRMDHSNVARVYELVQVQGSILVAMEYVDGKDLRASVEKGRESGDRLGYADVAYIMACALDGLHHAHQAVDERGDRLDVVHRDFSPSNVLVGYDGAVKLIDFGIAKARQNRIQTKTGIIKGKVKYMSPEQAFGHKLDRRSDVFSAGSVLYELCTGRPPFRAKTEIDLIFEVREATPTPPRTVNPELPPALAEIIDRSMARARSARYQTSLEFRDALVQFLRTYAPDYRRTRLARYMKRLWSDEIEDELRALEEWALDLPTEPGEDLGTNLLAAELGPDAPYAKFSPRPTRVTRPIDAVIPDRASDEDTHEPFGFSEAKTLVTPPDDDR
ncbi:MAG: serine/threonine protein kinase [Myxococcales bacterium]|nr:serine/threonine protein kinase [Myxococcales bacterium]